MLLMAHGSWRAINLATDMGFMCLHSATRILCISSANAAQAQAVRCMHYWPFLVYAANDGMPKKSWPQHLGLRTRPVLLELFIMPIGRGQP